MKKKDPENEIELPFEGESFKAAWDEWLRYRGERRLPKYVPTGLKKTFTNLLNISGNNVTTAIQIINQSIENNWQGLFPVKSNQYAKDIRPLTTSPKQRGAYELLEKARNNWNASRGSGNH